MQTSRNATLPAKNLKGITTYVKPDVYEELKSLAEEEDRTISNLVARILTTWMEERQKAKTED